MKCRLLFFRIFNSVYENATLGNGVSEEVQYKTVVLEKDGFEAVWALTEYGQQKSWLLNGWKVGKPDTNGEVGTQSAATQPEPTFSRQELGAGLLNNIQQNLDNANGVDQNGDPLVVYHESDQYVFFCIQRGFAFYSQSGICQPVCEQRQKRYKVCRLRGLFEYPKFF